MKKVIAVFTIFFIMTSCSENDSDNEKDELSIEGLWIETRYESPVCGDSPAYLNNLPCNDDFCNKIEFLGDGKSGTVSEIRTKDGQTKTVSVGTFQIMNDGKLSWCTNSGSCKLYRIELTNNELIIILEPSSGCEFRIICTKQ